MNGGHALVFTVGFGVGFVSAMLLCLVSVRTGM
jgi:hypothetical protein